MYLFTKPLADLPHKQIRVARAHSFHRLGSFFLFSLSAPSKTKQSQPALIATLNEGNTQTYTYEHTHVHIQCDWHVTMDFKNVSNRFLGYCYCYIVHCCSFASLCSPSLAQLLLLLSFFFHFFCNAHTQAKQASKQQTHQIDVNFDCYARSAVYQA